MGKSYLRYEQKSAFGCIVSPSCNTVVDHLGKIAFTGSGENVAVWNLKQGRKVGMLQGVNQAEITCLELSHSGNILAGGYSNGKLCIWDLNNRKLKCTFLPRIDCLRCLVLIFRRQ